MGDEDLRAGHSVSVAAVVIDDRDRVLTIRRRDTGQWQPPGGVLEYDEQVEAGLVREVHEETGAVVSPLALTGVYKNLDRGILALVFRCKVKGGHVRPTDEAEEVRWMTPAEVDATMDEVFAVRVRDALDYDRHRLVGGLPVRNHDGRTLVGSR